MIRRLWLHNTLLSRLRSEDDRAFLLRHANPAVDSSSWVPHGTDEPQITVYLFAANEERVPDVHVEELREGQ